MLCKFKPPKSIKVYNVKFDHPISINILNVYYQLIIIL